MTTTAPILVPARSVAWSANVVPLILRLGAGLCFIGHGAFGVLTKKAWLPYFAVAWIPATVAWKLMPWIGAVDILLGTLVLLAPRRWPLVYMVTWGMWTALLRPLAGESVFELVERAGNFGVPLALLLYLMRADHVRVRMALQWTTALLLAGHGALGVLGKPLLASHYTAIGLPGAVTPWIGVLELVLAAVVILRPWVGLLVAIGLWKVLTESLFVVAGAPVWEVVERAGSYAAPLALAMMMGQGRVAALELKDGPSPVDGV